MYSMLPKINSKYLSAIVALILILNFIVIGLNLNSLDNKKQIMNVEFKTSSEIIDIYNIYNSSTNHNLSELKKQISKIISDHVQKYFGIEKLIKEESNKSELTSIPYPLNLEMNFIISSSDLLKYEDYRIDKLFSNIQNYLKIDLNEKNYNLIIDNKNLQDKSKYYKNYLIQNNSLSTQIANNIISMIESNDLNELENLRMISILENLEDKINNNFIDNFDINVSTKLKDYRPALTNIIEKIFSYLIVLNVFIFIFLRYFKFKKK